MATGRSVFSRGRQICHRQFVGRMANQAAIPDSRTPVISLEGEVLPQLSTQEEFRGNDTCGEFVVFASTGS